MRTTVLSIVGARPQFVKLAPIHAALARLHGIRHVVLHTGQHYDDELSEAFFRVFGLGRPEINLRIGSGSHHRQTGRMLEKIGDELVRLRPAMVVVYGDTNSTAAGALAAAKLHIPIAHMEAGLRSYNRRMPEELNRVVTDHLSTLLFCPSDVAAANLAKEGIGCGARGRAASWKTAPQHVIRCGDLMYDIMRAMLPRVDAAGTARRLNPKGRPFILATIHRAESTDDPAVLRRILEALEEATVRRDVLLPLHPRTRHILRRRGMLGRYRAIRFVKPVSYLEMLALEQACAMVVTDSGGVQKEAFWLGKPCITIRDRTEWVETVRYGWNRLVDPAAGDITGALARPPRCPRLTTARRGVYGDGRAADGIARHLRDFLRRAGR